MTTGERFVQLMREHHYTQAELVRVVGGRISQSAIWKILNNKSTPTTATLELLAPAFGMTFTELAKALGLTTPAVDLPVSQHLMQQFQERSPEAEAVLTRFIERIAPLEYTVEDLEEALRIAELIMVGKRQLTKDDAVAARRPRRTLP